MTTIRHRIIRGYMLVLGLALTGSTAGLLVGNHLQKRAIALQEITIAERKLLSDLQVKILYNRPTKQLSPHLGNSAQFNKAGQAMIARVSSIQTLVKEHENIHQARARLNAGDISSEQQALYDQIEAYEQTLKIFRDRIQTFIQSVDDAYAQGEELEEAQQLLIDFVQSREFADFVQFPEELHAFVTIAEAEEIAAAQALKQAFALQTQIILSSLLLSSAIATLVALITSRVIAQPVQTVTAIARRVTDENNFDLQAPIEGKDEVSSLAQSLNQLIRKVKQLLSQLGQKNTDLEAALTQLNKQQIQLVQSEKMSSLGHLVAGIAHEINNPVNFIHGNLRHLKSHTQDLIEVITLYQQHCPNTDDTLQEAIEDIDLDFIQSDMSKMLGQCC
ncbi:MAG: HAMP domain-containing protein [Cyanobacteria bacterium P01_F01_bin.53]